MFEPKKTSHYSYLLWHYMNCEADTASLNNKIISTLIRSLSAAMAHTERKTDLFSVQSGTHVFVFEPASSL
jgi:hypothetical protein